MTIRYPHRPYARLRTFKLANSREILPTWFDQLRLTASHYEGSSWYWFYQLPPKKCDEFRCAPQDPVGKSAKLTNYPNFILLRCINGLLHPTSCGGETPILKDGDARHGRCAPHEDGILR
ncbi:MAG: hypothetical protein Q8M31_05700, partial [Beijerinckiaceae bacterium]|nr:hypothetical protein [Beijerinckiaceae bacterium]